jgi:translocation and assembly module TamB
MDYEIAGPLRFEASIDAVPVAALPRYLPEGATLLGEIGAEATGIFADGRLNANASLQINGLGLIATFEGDEASAMFERAALTATIADNRLVGEFELRLDNASDHASGRLELDDLFDPRSALRGQGNLTLNDLSLFSFFVPDLARARGEIFGQIEAGGNLIAPAFAGEIGLRDGSVNIGRAGISVTEIGLLLRQSKAGELSLQGSAKSGDGYLQIDGMTSFGTETGIRSEIRLNGEDFRLVRIPDLQVTASPAIVVLFDERATRVSGELGIPEASITINTVPETTAKPSADAIVHRGEVAITRPRRALFVDVTTRLGEAVAFSGFGLSTRLEGSVRISGDSKSPYTGLGRVVLQEGRYQAYGQNLEIESGELIFNGPLTNPALNVRATRTASDKTVAGIQLTGTPAQLSSRVYSEPPLGDAEALSYLLTGRPLSNANAEEGDMLNQAAFALGLTTAGSVASSIRNQLGLETFGIQGGSENRKLVAGKRIGDRLLVEYAYGVIDSLGTLLLRYQLSPRLMVESRSGSVRIVDVVYSVKRP